MKFAHLIAAVGFLSAAHAQNMSFGADNFYRSDNVTLQPVRFPSQYGHILAGNLFHLRGLSEATNGTTSRLPAVVVGHPMGAVKEQSANLYAIKLAEQGFVSISIDLPFWGASQGTPRNAVLPDLYAEAFSAAVSYLGTLSFVDRDRIGGVGICGSGSFLLSAAKIDQRIKAIATSSMYDMGAAVRQGLQRSQTKEQLKAVIAEATSQLWVEVNGGEVRYTGGTVQRLETNTSEVQREFYDFYRTRRGEFTPDGSKESLTTHPTLSTFTKFVNFYPFNDIDLISPRPVLFISGDQAHSREFSQDAYSLASEPKELVWVPGAGHVDLYDRVDLIPFQKLAGFFRSNLV